MRALTGMEIGGVTPFGLPDGLPILVDARVMDPTWIVLGGGNRSSKLKLAPDALRRLPSVRVIEGLAFVRCGAYRPHAWPLITPMRYGL